MSYEKIQTEEDFNKLKETGLFYELYPELSGTWEEDKHLILGEQNTFLLLPDSMVYLRPHPTTFIITSSITGEVLGVFKEVNGKLTFEGQVDEAGKVFTDFVCKTFCRYNL